MELQSDSTELDYLPRKIVDECICNETPDFKNPQPGPSFSSSTPITCKNSDWNCKFTSGDWNFRSNPSCSSTDYDCSESLIGNKGSPTPSVEFESDSLLQDVEDSEEYQMAMGNLDDSSDWGDVDKGDTKDSTCKYFTSESWSYERSTLSEHENKFPKSNRKTQAKVEIFPSFRKSSIASTGGISDTRDGFSHIMNTTSPFIETSCNFYNQTKSSSTQLMEQESALSCSDISCSKEVQESSSNIMHKSEASSNCCSAELSAKIPVSNTKKDSFPNVAIGADHDTFCETFDSPIVISDAPDCSRNVIDNNYKENVLHVVTKNYTISQSNCESEKLSSERSISTIDKNNFQNELIDDEYILYDSCDYQIEKSDISPCINNDLGSNLEEGKVPHQVAESAAVRNSSNSNVDVSENSSAVSKDSISNIKESSEICNSNVEEAEVLDKNVVKEKNNLFDKTKRAEILSGNWEVGDEKSDDLDKSFHFNLESENFLEQVSASNDSNILGRSYSKIDSVLETCKTFAERRIPAHLDEASITKVGDIYESEITDNCFLNHNQQSQNLGQISTKIRSSSFLSPCLYSMNANLCIMTDMKLPSENVFSVANKRFLVSNSNIPLRQQHFPIQTAIDPESKKYEFSNAEMKVEMEELDYSLMDKSENVPCLLADKNCDNSNSSVKMDILPAPSSTCHSVEAFIQDLDNAGQTSNASFICKNDSSFHDSNAKRCAENTSLLSKHKDFDLVNSEFNYDTFFNEKNDTHGENILNTDLGIISSEGGIKGKTSSPVNSHCEKREFSNKRKRSEKKQCDLITRHNRPNDKGKESLNTTGNETDIENTFSNTVNSCLMVPKDNAHSLYENFKFRQMCFLDKEIIKSLECNQKSAVQSPVINLPENLNEIEQNSCSLASNISFQASDRLEDTPRTKDFRSIANRKLYFDSFKNKVSSLSDAYTKFRYGISDRILNESSDESRYSVKNYGNLYPDFQQQLDGNSQENIASPDFNSLNIQMTEKQDFVSHEKLKSDKDLLIDDEIAQDNAGLETNKKVVINYNALTSGMVADPNDFVVNTKVTSDEESDSDMLSDITASPDIVIDAYNSKHQALLDLFQTDSSLSKHVIQAISSIDLKKGSTMTQIYKYIMQKRLIRPDTKLQQNVLTFLDSGVRLGILTTKGKRYCLAAEFSLPESKNNQLWTQKTSSITIAKKIASKKLKAPRKVRKPAASSNALKTAKLSEEVVTPKLKRTLRIKPKTIKTLRSRKIVSLD